jgi:ferric-dicitrate binding protein FerR (iron transport regulator)
VTSDLREARDQWIPWCQVLQSVRTSPDPLNHSWTAAAGRHDEAVSIADAWWELDPDLVELHRRCDVSQLHLFQEDTTADSEPSHRPHQPTTARVGVAAGWDKLKRGVPAQLPKKIRRTELGPLRGTGQHCPSAI